MKFGFISIFYFLFSTLSSIIHGRVEKGANKLTRLDQNLVEDEPFKDPDLYRDVPALIVSRGFKSQKYEIKTDDGYILAVYRILNPFFEGNAKPILLQHGIISSGRDWIVNSPGGHVREMFHQNDSIVGNNLGFELAKRGYDVWLANSRGNTYSRKHVRLTPQDPKFWDYSFDQMIKYDLPATIDFVLKTTCQKTIGYIGHSQGSQIMFGLLSTNGKYNRIIKPFIALSPVAGLAHIKTPFRYLTSVPGLQSLVSYIRGPLFPSDIFMKMFTSMVCNRKKYHRICESGMFLATGFDDSQLNETRLGVYALHTPAGTSTLNLLHLSQLIDSGGFAMYDHGWAINLFQYHSKSPPKYPLQNITCQHIALFTSTNDWMASPEDVKWLKSQLRVPLLLDYNIPFRNWNHADFLLAKEAGKYVNKRVIEVLKLVLP